MVLTEFAPRLWIGNVEDAKDVRRLWSVGVRAVLTCADLELPWCSGCGKEIEVGGDESPSALKLAPHDDPLLGLVAMEAPVMRHMALELFDTEDADMLGHLKGCLQFVGAALASDPDAGVMFHCWAGQSRCATLAVAHLMHTGGISPREALSVLQEKYPKACPNTGFMRQLHEFDRKGQLLLESPAPPSNPAAVTPYDMPPNADESFTCKSCRITLFFSVNVMPHEASDRNKRCGFSNKKGLNRLVENDAQCTTVFVDQMEWMVTGDEQTGKILCPNQKCRQKLGGWSWFGHQCSCGAWQSPSFHILKNKVDCIPREGNLLAI